MVDIFSKSNLNECNWKPNCLIRTERLRHRNKVRQTNFQKLFIFWGPSFSKILYPLKSVIILQPKVKCKSRLSIKKMSPFYFNTISKYLEQLLLDNKTLGFYHPSNQKLSYVGLTFLESVYLYFSEWLDLYWDLDKLE